MENKSIPILTCILIVAIIISTLYINSLRGYLSDCRFECNHLQTKVYMLEELSDVIGTLYQILPPEAWAQLKVLEGMRKNEKYKEFERYETPILKDNN